jgi:hypothetical protein
VLKLVLFCKSYRGDLLRFQRLWGSIQKHNVEQIPFYASVPDEDLSLFRQEISNSQEIHWLTDEEIVEVSPGGSINRYQTMDGRLSQQIVKAEAWRKVGCENYVCLDSDGFFIKAFSRKDFMATPNEPYTVIHQSMSFLEECQKNKKNDILRNFENDSRMVKDFFQRDGVNYDFGPTPVIWSSRVWSVLYEKTLLPSELSLWDAIERRPSELRWYGEAYLRFTPFALFPREPLFKVFHYKWQYEQFLRSGVPEKDVSRNYLGILLQSNWHDKKRRGLLKKIFKRM